MVLTDLINDLELNKTILIGVSGAVTGVVAGKLDFDNKVENSEKTFSSKDKRIEKESLIASCSLISGCGAFDSEGSYSSNFLELMTYTAMFRLGYEVSHFFYENYLTQR